MQLIYVKFFVKRSVFDLYQMIAAMQRILLPVIKSQNNENDHLGNGDSVTVTVSEY